MSIFFIRLNVSVKSYTLAECVSSSRDASVFVVNAPQRLRNARLLLLFLFGFISRVEIDGRTYCYEENFHPVMPLRNAYMTLLPELSRYLYANTCIPDMSVVSLSKFIYYFRSLKLQSVVFILVQAYVIQSVA